MHLKEDGFIKVEIPSTDYSEIEQSYIYVNNIVDVISNKISLDSKNDISFRPLTPISNRILHEIKTKPTQVLCRRAREGREGICVSIDIKLVWNENSTCKIKDVKYFVGFIQIYTYKNATTLRTNLLVTYQIHVTLLNFSDKFRLYLIDHGNKLVCFLPVGLQKMVSRGHKDFEIDWKEMYVHVQITYYIPLTSSSTGHDKNIISLHQSITMALKPLLDK